MTNIAQVFDFDSERALKDCKKHGPYTAKKLPMPESMRDQEHWSDCPTCVALIEAAKKHQKAEAQEKRLAKNLAEAGILDRFRDKSFDNFEVETPAQKIILSAAWNYCRHFDEHRKAGRCLIFMGGPGQGKTHLGVSAIKEIVKQGRTARYVREYDLLREMKATWTGGRTHRTAAEIEIVQKYVEPDLLVLDECGVQYFTDAEEVLIFQIIEGRYGAVKPTLAISNLGKPKPDKPRDERGKRIPGVQTKDIEDALGFRAYDRLMERGGISIEFKGDSYRRRPEVAA